jgi:hypothetical protein
MADMHLKMEYNLSHVFATHEAVPVVGYEKVPKHNVCHVIIARYNDREQRLTNWSPP